MAVDYNSILELIAGSPQYQTGTGLPGDTAAQRLNLLQDLESSLGIPLIQLVAGGGAAAQQQVPYTRVVYGNSPLFRDAFAEIDAGVDPVSATNAIVQAIKDKKVEYAGADVNDPEWIAKTQKVLEDYAFERAKTGSQTPTYTLPSGKKVNVTGDVLGSISEYELMGAPSLDDLMKRAAASRLKYEPKKAALTAAETAKNAFRGVAGLPTQSWLDKAPAPSFTSQTLENRLRERLGSRIDRAKSNMVASDQQQQAAAAMLLLRNLAGF